MGMKEALVAAAGIEDPELRRRAIEAIVSESEEKTAKIETLAGYNPISNPPAGGLQYVCGPREPSDLCLAEVEAMERSQSREFRTLVGGRDAPIEREPVK